MATIKPPAGRQQQRRDGTPGACGCGPLRLVSLMSALQGPAVPPQGATLRVHGRFSWGGGTGAAFRRVQHPVADA